MTSSAPLVSIIIPTRNRKELLLFAVRSALQQTYPNLQVVIHDNNSTDGTEKLIQPFLQDKRLEYYRTEKDLTMTQNWSGAFTKVRGDYFVRLDDDNILLPEYVASALQEINRLNLDVVIFSPLLVHAGKRLMTLFDTGERETVILNQYQWLVCEYFAYTDSNYAFYRSSLVRELFHDEGVYTTSLPDRYLNYRCIDAMKRIGIRVGFNPSVHGITRFDNQRPKVVSLHYVNYDRADPENIGDNVDCHHNYPMHRILTVMRMLDKTDDRALASFFNDHVTDSSLRTTVMRMGHIYSMFRASSPREAVIYLIFAVRIGWSLLTHFNCRIEKTSSGTQLLNLAAKTARYYGRTLAKKRNILTEEVDMSFGNQLIESALQGESRSQWQPSILHGKLSTLLESIRLTPRQ